MLGWGVLQETVPVSADYRMGNTDSSGTPGRSFLSHALLLLPVCYIAVPGDQNMPRTARKTSRFNIYHVMLRGINRQDMIAFYRHYPENEIVPQVGGYSEKGNLPQVGGQLARSDLNESHFVFFIPWGHHRV